MERLKVLGRKTWFIGFSAVCLAWLVARSGRRPDRLRYPCQQAAAAQSAWLIPAAGLALSRLVRSKRARAVLSSVMLVALLGSMAVGLGGGAEAGYASPVDDAAARGRAAALAPAVFTGAAADGSHDVFVVNHVPPARAGAARHDGVDALLKLLSEYGVCLYKSVTDASCASPAGLIASDDVVILKVNAAWDQRGMTNTDVVKGLIAAILAHPDGFTGEVVLGENCEGGPDYSQPRNNAEDPAQSFQVVVDSFADRSRVSSSSWWSFTDLKVAEYDAGDTRDGYVWLGNNVAYPKFTTGRGTLVSLKKGIWNGSGYDRGRLKLINVPVLKSHNASGTTGCIKNYMGVQSTHMTTNVHGDLIYGGFMGRLMNETIYPCLNVLDAIWVSPSHPRGPEGPYSLAARTDVLLAGLDPLAVDYYASKYVLYPVSGYGRHDPDTPYSENTNPYHDGSQNTGYPYDAQRIMYDTTAAALAKAGHDVTRDPSRIAIHLHDGADGVGLTGGHCVVGVDEPSTEWHFAEGTTRAGFDEWVCVQNPNRQETKADLEFMTPDGKVTPCSLSLPALSRGTVHVNRVVGPGKDVSCTVRSTLPVVAERPMYFDYRGAWTGGHTVTGAREPSIEWYFAEGYTGAGFDEWVCVLNPCNRPADLTLRFQTEEHGEVVKSGLTVGARSRATFKVNDLLGPGVQNSCRLESSQPVVAERPVYFDYAGTGSYGWNGGHCVMGATSPGKRFVFAEGTTRAGFEEWLTIQNPNAGAIDVSATYCLGEGQGGSVERSYRVEAGRRFTVLVSREVGPDKDVSIRLSSASPFLAERPVYFRYSGYGADYTGGHCVIGAPGASQTAFFAEGYTGGSFQEYLCLLNPGATDAIVDIAYMTEEAGALPVKTLTLPAGKRVTVRVNDDAGPNLQVSCRLEARKGGFVAERPMYFDY